MANGRRLQKLLGRARELASELKKESNSYILSVVAIIISVIALLPGRLDYDARAHNGNVKAQMFLADHYYRIQDNYNWLYYNEMIISSLGLWGFSSKKQYKKIALASNNIGVYYARMGRFREGGAFFYAAEKSLQNKSVNDMLWNTLISNLIETLLEDGTRDALVGGIELFSEHTINKLVSADVDLLQYKDPVELYFIFQGYYKVKSFDVFNQSDLKDRSIRDFLRRGGTFQEQVDNYYNETEELSDFDVWYENPSAFRIDYNIWTATGDEGHGIESGDKLIKHTDSYNIDIYRRGDYIPNYKVVTFDSILSHDTFIPALPLG